jgi:glucosamine--fructose-6-phosphate aminotransferase (isomerizing)
MDNMEIGEIFSNNVCFYNTDCERITKEPKTVTWSAEEAQKNGYEHFMMKEIHEQPEAVENTVRAFIMDNKISFLESGFTDEDFKKISRIRIVACGSAHHVGLISQYVIEDLADVPVRVEYASEFRYRKNIFDENELVIIISQSGETADSLFALREAKRNKIKTAAIVNVVGSSIARETDFAFYTLAGPEIAVATTKAYSAQLALCNMFAIELARVKGRINNEEYSRLIDELHTLPDKIRNILTDKDKIQWFASKFAGMKDAFLIGRGIDYGICLEGSLKMKEISYIHSEAYAAGELKHGTISLIENGTLAIGALTQDSLYEKTVNNLVEVKTRGAYIFALTTYGNYSAEEIADFTVFIPKTSKYFTPILAAVPLQLLGYYLSVARGLDVDKPRNLAKSVTVE